MEAVGTVSVDFMGGLLNQLANAGSHGPQIDEGGLNFMLSVVQGVKPKDQLEAMLAAQMAAIHLATMTFADPHHLRFAQPRALGMKVSDEFTVPLCRGHHRQLHQTGNEAGWWENLRIDALAIAKDLWKLTRTKDGRVDPQIQSTTINPSETTAKN